ncbi:MAG: hypothetical protein QOE56_769 [Solirubrobacterales bacterium]|jgi:hypothetical protein|nr:hypothetical protein [Solirubrobacterales bacterium]
MNRIRIGNLASKALIAAAVCLGTSALAAPSAQADLSFAEFGSSLSRLDGSFSRQAGDHPDLTVRVRVPKLPAAPGPVEDPREIAVDLPPGLTGNPTVAAECSFIGLVGFGGRSTCPPDAQIGTVFVETESFNLNADLFNMAHGPDTPALLGFNYEGVTPLITAGLRPGDYRISSGSLVPQAIGVLGFKLTVWGVPADSSHDPQRFDPNAFAPGIGGYGAKSTLPRRPFITSPTSCPAAPSSFTVRGDSWEHPGNFAEESVSSDLDGTPFVFEGCEALPFAPSVTAQPTSGRAAAPTGLAVDVKVPQNDSPDGFSTAHVRKTVIAFPKGVTVSASSANGLGACSLTDIKLGSNEAPTCPDSAKIGTVSIKTPLLADELQGNLILAKQFDNPFKSLLAVYIAVKGPGFYLKFPGKVEADPDSGQVTTTFDNTPQLPFSELKANLNGGPGAPLQAPNACGTYTTHVEMTSWAADSPVSLNTPMTFDQGCATGGFKPALRAGTVNPTAGSPSPFSLQVTRQDGEQNVSLIQTTLPPGLLAKLAGVGVCPEAQVAGGDCPASSQVGTSTVGAGAGPLPVYIPQPGKAPTAVYLAGPYKGAPYSLVVRVPAQAGPFDLGTVAVRNALHIDPVTTRVTSSSDPLPQILQGIPITYRDVRVEVNRPGFTLNPTSCDPMSVSSTIVSDLGAAASPSARFQVASCERLGFKPKLAMRFFGPTHRSAHPKFRATLTMPKGGANISRAAVTLPKTEFLENAHIQTICTRVQFRADACPAKSVYGHAKAWTPLLDRPLEGPVYLRSSDHELPDLVASLDGQIHVELAGRIDAVHARIRNTFDFVPDAPVSKFVLTMQGGKKGLLVNNTELCKTTPRAAVKFDGQNGKFHDTSPVVKTDCGKDAKKDK